MSAPLPPFARRSLISMPSPVEQSPGLLIRDSFRYSDAVLIVPPPLVQCLSCFDGQQTQLDLRALLVEISGQFEVGDLEDQLIGILTRSGFLEDETFQAMKSGARTGVCRSYSYGNRHTPARRTRRNVRSWAKPWGSGWGGKLRPPIAITWLESPRRTSVRAAVMNRIAPLTGCSALSTKDRTFVILGTSHYGSLGTFRAHSQALRNPVGRVPDERRAGRRTHETCTPIDRGRGLLPRRRALDRIPGVVSAIDIRAGYQRSTDPLRFLRAEHLSRREAGIERKRESIPWRAG